jgi:glutathione peroxidase
VSGLPDLTLTDIDGGSVPLSGFAGRPLLIVNTASQCGFTPQYQGLELLNRDYAAQGLAVLGFPCNQFGAQEPGDAAEIASFCRLNYDVRFALFARIDVNGPAEHPLFTWLKAQAPGLLGTRRIKWNFTKFLVDRTGARVTRFGPGTKPEALTGAIEALL